MPREEVGAPPALSSKISQVFKGVDAIRNCRVGPVRVVLLVELAQLDTSPFLSTLADPGCRHAPASGVHSLTVALLEHAVMNAHVPPRTEAQGQDLPALRADAFSAVVDNSFQFFNAFHHLRHRTSAVDELAHLGPGKLNTRDQGHEANSLACTGGHFECSVSRRFKCTLQFHHVVKLFPIH
eukprot:scaffold775_cov274-Pinguiococcus_pyrenoidosus.AAC.1